MNISELARRLNVLPEELREKLPKLGFSIGKHAIKVDDRIANQIMKAWGEMRQQERLQKKMEDQKRQGEEQQKKTDEHEKKPLVLPAVLTVREFASLLQIPVPRLMQELMHNGIMASINERIDFETASIVAEDLGFLASPKEKEENDQINTNEIDRIAVVIASEQEDLMKERPPVIVVMGHVDHGKTKLLDAIRKTNVVDTEAGGITQHIGAYQVERQGRLLTFIDTPGHEAFTVMRSRGAKVADIAILVVAADDGVQPQTKEVIDIIKGTGIPFVVALNKIDRPEANIDRVKGQLAESKVVSEDWGGTISMVPISAKQQQGIDTLLDTLLLTADIQKTAILANPLRPAIGTIIESHVDVAEGPVATMLVQVGTLHLGDIMGINGAFYGRVRGMRNWMGVQVKEAPPSMPVKIIGFKHAPAMGDILEVSIEMKDLKKFKESPSRAVQEVASLTPSHTDVSQLNDEVQKRILPIILRTDMLGSLEAILGMFDKIQHPSVGVEIVQKGLGNITDVDVVHAETSGATIYGFNTHPSTSAERLALEKNITIKEFKVIYKLFEDVLDKLQEMLPSELIIEESGKMEVISNFRKTDQGWIVGGRVKVGKIRSGVKIRILRAEKIIGEGEVISTHIGASQVKEIREGQECGLHYKGKVKAETGDLFEFYIEEKKERLLMIEGIRRR